MNISFFQACYAHADSGWSLINCSPEITRKVSEDFLTSERVNASASSNEFVPMGKNENPSCMMEIYCKNDTIGAVRVIYQMSDRSGRPISFSHGFLIPRAYDVLKQPESILGISKENFADQRLSDAEKQELKRIPGALSRELIKITELAAIPNELKMAGSFSVETALQVCGMDNAEYQRWMKAVFSQLFMSNAQKTLYVKTDGTEEYALNLLFLTYKALPYSLRTQISASTMLHKDQRNTRIIFCADVPAGVQYISSITGDNNIFSDALENRIGIRNPIISSAVNSVIQGRENVLFDSIEASLTNMGNSRLLAMQGINLAFSIFNGEIESPDTIERVIYNWLSLSIPNNSRWESYACMLLKRASEMGVGLSDDTKELLSSRRDTSKSEEFLACVAEHIL